MNAVTLSAIVSLLAAAAAAAELAFTYADQAAWAALPESQCGGLLQSPVDLNIRSALPNPRLGRQLVCSWQRLDALIGGKLINNGRTIELDVETPHFCIGIPGLRTEREFRLAKVHIHLGRTNNEGSEHRINGRFGTLEVHMVHFDTAFGTFELASRQPNGIMVTAIVFDQVMEGLANAELSKLALVTGALLQRVQAQTEFLMLARTLIGGTGLELAHELFFTYSGSLTTPTCNEVVTWIVAAGRGRVGCKSLALLRTAQAIDGGLIAPNFRALQPLNGRGVVVSFET